MVRANTDLGSVRAGFRREPEKSLGSRRRVFPRRVAALQAQLKQIGATETLRIYRPNPAKSYQRIYAPDNIPLPRREDSDCEVTTVYELG